MATLDRTYPILTIKYIVGDYLPLEVLIEDPVVDFDPEDPQYEPRDLTGWSASAQVRETLDKDSLLIADFTIPELDSTGVIAAALVEVESLKLAALPPRAGGYWDLQLRDPDGKPTTILGGPIKPKGDVTRD